jgi:hypothetical protein
VLVVCVLVVAVCEVQGEKVCDIMDGVGAQEGSGEYIVFAIAAVVAVVVCGGSSRRQAEADLRSILTSSSSDCGAVQKRN